MLKTAIVLAVAVAASSVSGYATYPNFCGTDEFAKLAVALVTNGQDIKTCQESSKGWVFIPPTGTPTTEQQTEMCKNPACHRLAAGLLKLQPADCFLSTAVPMNSVGLNVKQFTEEFEPFCELVA